MEEFQVRYYRDKERTLASSGIAKTDAGKKGKFSLKKLIFFEGFEGKKTMLGFWVFVLLRAICKAHIAGEIRIIGKIWDV